MAKFCAYCGSEMKEGSKFCGACGAANEVQDGTNNNFNTSNTNQTMTAQQVYGTTQNVNANEAKSKTAAGILGIILGALGVHNFYLGYTGKAVAQLLITILSCGILSPISAIWGLVEGICILSGSITTDGKGNRLVD